MNKLFVHISSLLLVMVFPMLVSCGDRGPRMRIFPRQTKAETLSLPSNATSIREQITDNFSCENRTYGYYADVENECQIFHVCLPVVYANGKAQTFKWSFICPEETIFNQEVFTCARAKDSIRCEDSEEYYVLNDSFGDKEVEEDNGETDANTVDDGGENAMVDPQQTMEEEVNNRRKRPMNKEKQKKPDDRSKPRM